VVWHYKFETEGLQVKFGAAVCIIVAFCAMRKPILDNLPPKIISPSFFSFLLSDGTKAPTCKAKAKLKTPTLKTKTKTKSTDQGTNSQDKR